MEIKIKKLMGGREYQKHLEGGKLTRKEAMLAHCYECSNAYESEKDCKLPKCPMYGFQPYAKS
jgi:hypothetical protein